MASPVLQTGIGITCSGLVVSPLRKTDGDHAARLKGEIFLRVKDLDAFS